MKVVKNKISETELKEVKDLTIKVSTLLNTIGALEAEKHEALHSVHETKMKLVGKQKELNDKYGLITINLEDGSYEEDNVGQESGE